jgi:deazaflavin-dependent oxidoreductase (nitroreductase family)
MPLHDRPPQGCLAALFRLPAHLYRWHLGWLLGSRFLLLRHRGRKTGVTHENVLEVIARDRGAGNWYVASGWGERAQWYRNIVADGRVAVSSGRHTFDAEARPLPREEGRRTLDDYRRRHRWAIKGLQRVFGYDSYETLAEATPIVEIHELGGPR